MAVTIRETIVLAVKTAIEGIVGLDKVFLPGDGNLMSAAEGRYVYLLDFGDRSRRHVRGAYENTIRGEAVCVNREPDPATQYNESLELAGNVVKKLTADESWAGNAVSTDVGDLEPDLNEAGIPTGLVRVPFEIQYRVVRTDPFTVKAI